MGSESQALRDRLVDGSHRLLQCRCMAHYTHCMSAREFHTRGWLAVPAVLVAGLLWLGTATALDPGKDFHHYVRTTWSIEEGLPQISAQAIAQDDLGYLWVGTQAGLARFDGNRFVAYTPEDTPELPGGFITDLLHDAAGRLWIATYKGVAMHGDGRFAAVPLVDEQDRPLNVLDLAMTDDGSVLAAAENAVYVIDELALRRLHRLPGPVHALMPQGDTLWVGSRGGVYRIDADARVEFLPMPADAGGVAVTRLLQAQGRIWAGTSEGLFENGSGKFQRYRLDPALAERPIEALFEDGDDNLWIADIAHLSRLRDGVPRERIERADAGLSVRALFEDREGNLWLGSQWNGLTRLRDGWTRRFSVREGLHTALLWSLAEAEDGSLWVGTDDGLSRFRDGRFEPVVSAGELPHPNAYTLLVEGETVWIGTRRGLAVLRGSQLQQPAEFDALRSAQINGIVRDHAGVLWFATTQGLYRFDDAGLSRFGEAQGLRDPRVRFILQTRSHDLLLGTNSGLFRLRDGHAQEIGVAQGLRAGLDVTALLELPGGELVLGSLAESLYFFNGERWVNLGAGQGMPSNAAFFLAHDADYLWVAGIRGIARVPLQDLRDFAAGQIAQVRGEMLLNERGDRRGGQKGFCCNGAGNAKGLMLGEELWAPTRDGLVAFNTKHSRSSSRVPTTLIERVRVAGEWRRVSVDANLALDAKNRDVAFEFTGISFEDPRSVGFRFRLLGYHQDWREPDEVSQRVVSYTNLAPGDYRFELQGASRPDDWSPTAALDFSIKAYFHETAAFRIFLGLLFAGVIYLVYLAQRREHQRNERALQRLVGERTEALAAANLQLEVASQTDQLTGLRNRRYLAAQMPKDLAFYERELRRGAAQDQVMVFAIIDIDHFKPVNDLHGHAAGDEVLKQIAQVLLKLVRTGDYVVRWGGEEFIIVFRPTPPNLLPLLGERVRKAVAEHRFDLGAGKIQSITCSIGLVEHPLFVDAQTTLEWEQLLELADRALYHVKRNGRNGWAAYRPAPGVTVSRVLELLWMNDDEFANSPDLELLTEIVGLAPPA